MPISGTMNEEEKLYLPHVKEARFMASPAMNSGHLAAMIILMASPSRGIPRCEGMVR